MSYTVILRAIPQNRTELYKSSGLPTPFSIQQVPRSATVMGKNSLLNKAWGVKGNKLKVAKVTAAKKRGGDGLTDSERALAYSYHVEVSQQGKLFRYAPLVVCSVAFPSYHRKPNESIKSAIMNVAGCICPNLSGRHIKTCPFSK